MLTEEQWNILLSALPQLERFYGIEQKPAAEANLLAIYRFYSAASVDIEQLRLQKKKLRAVLRKKRDALSAHTMVQLSKQAAMRFTQLPEYQNCHVLFIPLSFGSELSTAPLISSAFAAGKRVLVPAVRGKNMLLQEITPETTYHKADFGIMEPDGDVFTTEIPELTLLPALAFSPLGFRVGYGGGYYDRFLVSYVGKSVGICLPGFIENFIPEPHDIPSNRVIVL